MQLSPAFSSNEREYWERDKHHYERNFINDNYKDDSINLIKLQKDQHYSILPRKFNKVYDNIYYDNFTNEDDYYEDKEDSDLGSDSEAYYPVTKKELDVNEHSSDCTCIECKNHTLYVPFIDLNKYFLTKNNKVSLSYREINEIIDNIKLKIEHNRFKLMSFKLTIKDIEPFYRFIDLNDKSLYQDMNHFKIGIYINKDSNDPTIRENTIKFAFMYFAFELYCYNYDHIYETYNILMINQLLNGEINDKLNNAITRVFRFSQYYSVVYDYKDKDLSFLDYTIPLDTNDEFLLKCIKNGFNSHHFGILKLSDDKFPFITVKVPYRKITQEEIKLLEDYPIEAAFIYKNYPYLQDTSNTEINIDPFFNMLRILKKAQYRLNIISY